ncbi:hypothetical protein FACS1894188_12550 [Clostridia bacterium]|nr:hypothetical protein FACS1894188_12550 [Clostridia bacterium]
MPKRKQKMTKINESDIANFRKLLTEEDFFRSDIFPNVGLPFDGKSFERFLETIDMEAFLKTSSELLKTDEGNKSN